MWTYQALLIRVQFHGFSEEVQQCETLIHHSNCQHLGYLLQKLIRPLFTGKLAETTEKEYQRERDLTQPVIAIVASAKLEIFKTSLQINTLSSSIIYFNLDNYAVNEMRKRGMSCAKSKSARCMKLIVGGLLGVSFANKRYTIWRKRFKCRRNMPSGETRYKIKVLVEDSTQAVDVILHDRAIKRLIGKTAFTMIDELGENGELAVGDNAIGDTTPGSARSCNKKFKLEK